MSTSLAVIYITVRNKPKARNRTPRAHKLGLMWYFDPYTRGRAVQLGTRANWSSKGRRLLRRPRTACWRGLHERHGDVTKHVTKRPRDASARLHARQPAALSDELGGLSTSLGPFASPPLILSTESVVVVKLKGMSTAIATRVASPGRPHDARRQRGIGTARAHELGLMWNFDPCTRGWAVQPGAGANGRSSGRLLLRKPRTACWRG